MYLLYLDASGDPGWIPPDGRSPTRWYVLAGLCLEESKWGTAKATAAHLAEKYFRLPLPRPRELRYSSLRGGVKPYDKLDSAARVELMDDVFAALTGLGPVLFGVAVDKGAHRAAYGSGAFDPDSWSLRLLLPRFHKFLERQNTFGAIMMDSEERRKEGRLWKTVEAGREDGIVLPATAPSPYARTSTKLERLVENVLFLRSESSYMIQFADFCAGAIWTHFERGDSDRFKQLVPLFDHVGPTNYGLKVWQPSRSE
jgi:Protein of unknown function (DUF3800)